MRTAPRVPLGVHSVALLTFCVSVDAIAYEQTTHAAMTREAMMQSQLSPSKSELLQRLGIAEHQTSLGNTYLDLLDGSSTAFRSSDPTSVQYPAHFGPSKIKDANRLALFRPASDSLPGWLMLGAIREDDVSFDRGAAENNPQDDPVSQMDRVLNHFYDPYNNRALEADQPVAANTAPDWALIDTEGYPPGSTGNHFNILSAREAMWRALTLRSSPAQGFTDLPFTPSTDIPTKGALRIAYWATTFRALGDVVHLLQDMAQPQHTRNDSHSGMGCVTTSKCLAGHASFYEKYVDANVRGDSRFTLRERDSRDSLWPGSWAGGSADDRPVSIVPHTVNYGGYPIPRFPDYRSYFMTATGLASLAGKGLANYSNQGFYSAGTNVLANKYPSPPADGSGLASVVLPKGTVQDANEIPVDGVLVLRTGTVTDAANRAYDATAVRLTSYGMFDQFLSPIGKPQYTLNHYNYDDQMRLLIPRAVAYSAGLLDLFFRGRMEISLPDEGVYGIVDHAQFASGNSATDPLGGFKGFDQIRLRLSNSTPEIVTTGDNTHIPQGMTSGTLVAVIKFHRNRCYRDTLDGEITDPQQLSWCRTDEEEIVVSDPIKIPDQGTIPLSSGSQGGSAEFKFKFSDKALPINAWDVVLQVVYRGQLGSEADAVVVETKRISEPTFMTTFNDTDRILIAGSCYDADTVANNDTLWNQLSAVCKPTSGSQRYITSNCVFVPLSARLTMGSAGAPVAFSMESSNPQSTAIAPRRFGRFAILGDFTARTPMALGFNYPLEQSPPPDYPNYRAEQEDKVTFSGNAYQVTRSTIADSYGKHRGIKTWDSLAFIVDGATAKVGGSCPEAQFDALQGSERQPQKSVITGWEDL